MTEVMFCVIAKPAASSLAELIRVPVDSCSIAVFMLRVLVFNAFCEYKALTLVLIDDIVFLQR
jgi:hypothetical protein